MGNEIKKYLGIDWGESKIGLAMADSELKIALALETVENKNDIIEKIKSIIKEEDISEIVIGVPFDSSNKDVAYGGEEFGKILGVKINIPINYQNEMFTTKMAQANLIQKGEKNIGKIDDRESARIILQEWLDDKAGK